jgi:hypothetical protein
MFRHPKLYIIYNIYFKSIYKLIIIYITGFDMEEINITMTLTERDFYINQIEQQIQEKEQLLINKYKQINNLAEKNEFLTLIKNDYTNYYNYIVKEKKEQIFAMENINTYLNSLFLNTKLSADKINDAKLEQQRILREMDIIKTKLNNIIT